MSSTITMKSWAKRIDSYKDVPVEFTSRYESHAFGMEKLPYTVFTPGTRYASAALVYIIGGMLYVLKNEDGVIREYSYMLHELNYAELDNSLLYSTLKISGVRDGMPNVVEIVYNNVSETLFEPILNTLRAEGDVSATSEKNIQCNQVEFLSEISLNLLNGMNASIRKGVQIIDVLVQKEGAQKKHFWKAESEAVAKAHLSVLTDKELILVRERGKRDECVKYGITVTYIPVHRINRITTGFNEKNDLYEMSINMAGDDVIKNCYSITNQQKVDEYVFKFNQAKRYK